MRLEIIRESIESIIQSDGRIVISFVENKSESTDRDISPYMNSLIHSGKVLEYVLFDENITNNALDIALLDILQGLRDSEYIIISDADVWVPPGTVEEQLTILKENSNISAVGLQIDASRWTSPPHIQAAREYMDTIAAKTDPNLNYIPSSKCGFWFVMFRTEEFFLILKEFRRNGVRFVDGHFQKFIADALRKMWVITKKSVGRELTRENWSPEYWTTKSSEKLNFREHSPEESGYALYNHDKISDAIKVSADLHQKFIGTPFPVTASKRRRIDWEDDPVVTRLNAGEIKFDTLRYRRRFPRLRDKPGLYLIREGNLGSLPFYGGDKAVIRLGGGIVPPRIDTKVGRIDAGNILEYYPYDAADEVLVRLLDMLEPNGVLEIYSIELSSIVTEMIACEGHESVELLQSDTALQYLRNKALSNGEWKLTPELKAIVTSIRALHDTRDLQLRLERIGFQRVAVFSPEERPAQTTTKEASFRRVIRGRKRLAD